MDGIRAGPTTYTESAASSRDNAEVGGVLLHADIGRGGDRCRWNNVALTGVPPTASPISAPAPQTVFFG